MASSDSNVKREKYADFLDRLEKFKEEKRRKKETQTKEKTKQVVTKPSIKPPPHKTHQPRLSQQKAPVQHKDSRTSVLSKCTTKPSSNQKSPLSSINRPLKRGISGHEGFKKEADTNDSKPAAKQRKLSAKLPENKHDLKDRLAEWKKKKDEERNRLMTDRRKTISGFVTVRHEDHKTAVAGRPVQKKTVKPLLQSTGKPAEENNVRSTRKPIKTTTQATGKLATNPAQAQGKAEDHTPKLMKKLTAVLTERSFQSITKTRPMVTDSVKKSRNMCSLNLQTNPQLANSNKKQSLSVRSKSHSSLPPKSEVLRLDHFSDSSRKQVSNTQKRKVGKQFIEVKSRIDSGLHRSSRAGAQNPIEKRHTLVERDLANLRPTRRTQSLGGFMRPMRGSVIGVEQRNCKSPSATKSPHPRSRTTAVSNSRRSSRGDVIQPNSKSRDVFKSARRSTTVPDARRGSRGDKTPHTRSNTPNVSRSTNYLPRKVKPEQDVLDLDFSPSKARKGKKPRKSILKTPSAADCPPDTAGVRTPGVRHAVRFTSPTPELLTRSAKKAARHAEKCMRSKLDTWLTDTGRTPTRFRHLSCFCSQTECEDKMVDAGLTTDELSLQQERLEAETGLNTQTDQILSEALVILDLDGPLDVIESMILELGSQVMEAKHLAKYWVCRARLAEARSDDIQAVDMFEQAVRNNAKPPEDVANALKDFLVRMQQRQQDRLPVEQLETEPVDDHGVPALRLSTQDYTIPRLRVTPARRNSSATPRKSKSPKQPRRSGSAIMYCVAETTPLFTRVRGRTSATPHAVVTPVRRSARLSELELPEMLQDHDLILESLDTLPQDKKDHLLFTPNRALDNEINSCEL